MVVYLMWAVLMAIAVGVLALFHAPWWLYVIILILLTCFGAAIIGGSRDSRAEEEKEWLDRIKYGR